MIQPADHNGPGHPHLVALAPECGGRGVDALDGRHHEKGRVGSPQSCAEFAGEVTVARSIQEIYLDAVHHEGGYGEHYGALLVNFGGFGVADCRPVGDRSHP
ncbi:hypothetical protein D9M72_444060 [compost metagenome]